VRRAWHPVLCSVVLCSLVGYNPAAQHRRLDGSVQIVAETVADATVEIWDANQRAGLFRKAFGVDVEVMGAAGTQQA
jgi:hypothetical protein